MLWGKTRSQTLLKPTRLADFPKWAEPAIYPSIWPGSIAGEASLSEKCQGQNGKGKFYCVPSQLALCSPNTGSAHNPTKNLNFRGRTFQYQPGRRISSSIPSNRFAEISRSCCTQS